MKRLALPTLCALIFATGFAPAAGADQPAAFDGERHLSVDDVEPGMKGYGMTVFEGATPDAFRIEVVSVEQGFNPGKAVVWIRATDDRLQESGPVQGMSGSPIYIWTEPAEDDAPHVPGEGGKLLGAFAYGFAFGKDAYVGVQPIEQMLDAGSRATGNAPDAASQAAGARELALEGSHFLSQKIDAKDYQTWRLAALSELAGFEPRQSVPGLESEIEALGQGGQGVLPLLVGSSRHAELVSPFFTPLGLFPTSSPHGMASGNAAPPWIQAEQVEIGPGSVLAIPLAFGPMELSAIGTATDVLEDGRVLGFGHSMFAQGDIAVPMATGYVHFIQPNIRISFKLGGSLDVQGAIVRDESAAVVGRPDAEFRTLPATINFNWPGGDLSRTFEYDLVHHERLLPGLLATIAMESLASDVELPRFNTVHVRGSIDFDNGATVELDELIPNASPANVALAVVPAIGTLIDTEFGHLGVDSVELDVDIQNEPRLAEISDVTLERGTVRPGETIRANVRLVPFREDPITEQIEIEVPHDIAEGRYMLMVGGARAYQQHLSQRKPHLMLARSKDELVAAVQEILAVRDDALYGVLTLNPDENDLAIGRSELPRLPSSRRAMLNVDSSTRAMAYVEGVEQIDPQPFVVDGGVSMTVEIRHDASARR